MHTKNWLEFPFAGAYVALAVIAMLSMALMSYIEFPPVPPKKASDQTGRPLNEIMRQPVFFVATLSAALGYGVMNLLMAATPLAMQVCGLSFEDTAWVLQWHVIGMFAPGFVTGHLIKRFGVLSIMGVGVLLNIACIGIALSGVDIHEFLLALFLLGVGWNFLFTGSTTLSMQAYTPQEKDKAQAAINFCVFSTMAVTSFASGALVTTQGWTWLNWGSLLPVVITAGGLLFLRLRFKNV
jgi:predicted MFS family arabinose efflux permease